VALRATIFKAELHVADNDRNYYGSHSLTIARHPSETDERMMVRVLAYALYADSEGHLAFTRGLSETDEPDLWRKDLTGDISLWVEIGLPDERRILKGCSKSLHACVIAYGRNAGLWWQGIQHSLRRVDNLSVYVLDPEATSALAELAAKKMTLNINVDDGHAWVSNDINVVNIQVVRLR